MFMTTLGWEGVGTRGGFNASQNDDTEQAEEDIMSLARYSCWGTAVRYTPHTA